MLAGANSAWEHKLPQCPLSIEAQYSDKFLAFSRGTQPICERTGVAVGEPYEL